MKFFQFFSASVWCDNYSILTDVFCYRKNNKWGLNWGEAAGVEPPRWTLRVRVVTEKGCRYSFTMLADSREAGEARLTFFVFLPRWNYPLDNTITSVVCFICVFFFRDLSVRNITHGHMDTWTQHMDRTHLHNTWTHLHTFTSVVCFICVFFFRDRSVNSAGRTNL